MRSYVFQSFTYYDPLLLLPRGCRSGLLVGDRADLPEILAGHVGSFETSRELASGPPLDALVVLDWPNGCEDLARRAAERLQPGGMLLACLPNGLLPPAVCARLYRTLGEIPPNGASLARIRRAMSRQGLAIASVYAWIPSDTFPYALFPVDDTRMFSFFLDRLLPKAGARRMLAAKLAPMLSARVMAPYFFVLARKEA